jgi:hypothetical protein
VLITELLIDPDAVGDTLGEWLELHNAGDAPVNLAGWSLGTLERSEHVIAAELWLPPNAYVVLARNDDACGQRRRGRRLPLQRRRSGQHQRQRWCCGRRTAASWTRWPGARRAA